MAPVPWRWLVWWPALHPPATKASTPVARRASRSAPGPNRALAPHARTIDRTTRPQARQQSAQHPQPTDPTAGLPPLHRKAAGIDVGRAEHSVAVPPARAPEPGRRCASLTADRQAVADGLHACRIETVVMASPGVDGIPLCHILEARGVEVPRVQARQAKHRPGRQTDLADCQWRQTLHTGGLLHRAFRPPDDLCVRRSSVRPREPLISAAATCLQHRPKARTELHVHRAHVIRDIRGGPGWAMIRAWLAGDRDPTHRAAFTDDRLQASTPTIAQRLAGHGRDAWRCNLRPSLARDDGDQQQMAEGDSRLAAHRHTVDRRSRSPTPLGPPPRVGPRQPVATSPHLLCPPHGTASAAWT